MEQRTRHLLAKLKPALRTAIVSYHEVPKRRDDLLSLATRLESAGKRDGGGSQASIKRSAPEKHDSKDKSFKKRKGSPPPRERKSDRSDKSKRPDKRGKGDKSEPIVCWTCDEPGHISPNCPNKDKAAGRKVTASAPAAKQEAAAGEGPTKAVARNIRDESIARGVESWPAKILVGEVETYASSVRVECILDDGADVNLVSRKLMLQTNLRKVNVAIPEIEGFQGTKSVCYGAYSVRLRLADSTGEARLTERTFYCVDMPGNPDLILGRPWRRDHGVIVDSRDDKWWYGDGAEKPAFRMRSAREFDKDLRNAPRVYAVSLIQDKEYVLPFELKNYEDVMAGKDLSSRPLPKGIEYAIDLELGKKPPFRPLYSLSVKELAELRKYIEEALKNS